ncbi:MAG: hypothetical protein VW804_07290, partial [Verrucomicrobiota bacterium]
MKVRGSSLLPADWPTAGATLLMGMRLLLKLFLVLVAQIKLYAETKPTQISIDPLVAFYLTASDAKPTQY